MPVALETSKRKFQNLLDNLTTGSPPSESSTRPGTEDGSPSAKRSRVTLRAIAANAEGAASSTTLAKSTARRSVAAGGRRTTSADSSTKREPPNYTPWSHELFLRRLQTFSDLRRWTSKPDAVNEVQWAKRGWVCEDVNKVACRGGCEQRVVVSLRPPRQDAGQQDIEGSEDYSVEVDEALVGRYAELIVTGHGESCLWRGAGCKDDIYRLPIARPTIWQPQLRSRYASLAKIPDLPSLGLLSCPADSESLLASLPTGFFSSPSDSDEPSPEVNLVAFTFALFGWHGSDEGSGNTMATCDVCFRRIGLWLYRNKADSTGEEATANKDLDDAMKLDLVYNHRDYCPWINAESQSMPGSFAGLAGWEILQRVVQNSATHHETKPLPELPLQDVEEHEFQPTALTAKESEKADKVRFARLKELTKAMSFKGLKKKPGKGKAGL